MKFDPFLPKENVKKNCDFKQWKL